LEASCRVAFAIAKETACNWGVTYQTVHYGYNRKGNKRRNLGKLIYQTIQYVVVCIMLCDILDNAGDEIQTNKARVTLQLDESIRDAGTTVGQGRQ